MNKSKDGIIELYQGNTPSDVIYPPASWSVVNVPVNQKEANDLFLYLNNTATARHVMMVVCRHKRKDRVKAVGNLPEPLSGWIYYETVSIFYEKPSTCSNNGFLPLAESAWIFHKGDSPDAKCTEWFTSGEYNNATNLWNVALQAEEGSGFTYYQKFNAETQMILMSLAGQIENKRFIYTLPLDKNEQISLFKFCHRFGLTAALYTESDEESNEILTNYDKFMETK